MYTFMQKKESCEAMQPIKVNVEPTGSAGARVTVSLPAGDLPATLFMLLLLSMLYAEWL